MSLEPTHAQSVSMLRAEMQNELTRRWAKIKSLEATLTARDAEIERLTKGNEAMKRILASIMPEQIPGPFICGAVGQPGDDGLHDGYLICPTYGAGGETTQVYRRQKK